MNPKIHPMTMLAGALAIIFLILCIGGHVLAREKDDTALWLARSAIGECGWSCHETGEAAAIWHVYQKRGIINGKGTLWTARRYSAAIKRGPHQRNKWVVYLSSSERPNKWPRNLDWSKYRDRWLDTLGHARAFVAGEVVDPLPSAVHYGSRIDKHRAGKNWRRVKAPFRNLFWRVL